jgi:hypothetical protein
MKLFPVFLACAALPLFSCATQSAAPVPAWAAAPNGIRAVYPDSAYIAQEGRGPTRQAAETDGAARIARFFNSEIRASSSVRTRAVEQNGVLQDSVETETAAFVESQMSLFGIRYSGDAFYDRAQKEWRVVASIDRAEAWQIYGPRFQREAGAFQKLFDAAETEGDPFKRALRYVAAQDYAGSAAFTNAEVFGQLLYPAQMNAEFAEVRAALAGLPQKLDSAKRAAAVYIDCPVDFESLVYNAFSQGFTAQGFPVAKNSSSAAAVCAVTLSEGEQKRETGTFYHPSLQAVVSGPSGVVLTFNAQGEQAAAVRPDVAKRRAYQSLAEQVKKTFSLDAVD